MRRRWPKYLRAGVAVAVFAILLAAFLDFRGLTDARWGHFLASVQFVPSAVALGTGATASVAGILILVATLVFGRVYCSVLCPLGIFQDLVWRVAGWMRRKPLLVRYARPAAWVRQMFLWITVAGIATGWAGLSLALLDPYSVFGRFASMVFRPLVIVANNWIVGPANAVGIDWFYRVQPQWAAIGALALPAFFLVVVVVLSARRGRLYCNSVCPVGTLLGMASGIGGWRLEIDHSRCRKCGDCLRVCKAQCIDLRAGTIDNSRCIACYNCIGACDELGIQHRFKWKPLTAGSNTTAAQNSVHGSSGPATPRSNSRQVVANPNSGDAPPAYPSRRAFLTTTAAALTAAGGLGAAALTEAADTAGKPSCPTRRVPISPPGTGSIERFLDRCTACQLCVSVCPTHVLQPSFLEYGLAGIMKPHLDFERSFCNFECTSCGDICPDGAILRLAPADKKLTCIGVADIDYDKCIVKTNGTDCAACSEHCPTQAVSTVPYGNNLRLPQMHRGLCIGCGACEYACPVRPARAITVSAKLVHTRARRKVESPAINPSSGSDFPF